MAKLRSTLFELIDRNQWNLKAWAVFSNHYHFVAIGPSNPESLASIIRGVHSITAKYVNKLDCAVGRRVWSNYWDTCITNEGSYLARLKYVHMNAVKHGLVDRPEGHEFCSYGWFMQMANDKFKEAMFTQPDEKVAINDRFKLPRFR